MRYVSLNRNGPEADTQVHRDRVYIFEEYCEGGSLANLLEHGRVEEEDVVTVYAIQMLQGLAYLHGKGIEHRDVKPDSTSPPESVQRKELT